MFVDQLKNTRAALLDVALERSHSRRLVCARGLGKMQQKAIIRCKNLLGNTLIRRTFSEIEVKLLYAIRGASRAGICLADSGGPGLRCQAISFALIDMCRNPRKQRRDPRPHGSARL